MFSFYKYPTYGHVVLLDSNTRNDGAAAGFCGLLLINIFSGLQRPTIKPSYLGSSGYSPLHSPVLSRFPESCQHHKDEEGGTEKTVQP